MTRYERLSKQIEMLIRENEGTTLEELVIEMRKESITKTEIKILLRHYLGTKWKLVGNSYLPVLTEPEEDLFQQVEHFKKDGQLEKAFNLVMYLRTHFPNNENYLWEAISLAQEMNHSMISTLMNEAFHLLQKKAEQPKEDNPFAHLRMTNSPSLDSPLTFVRIGVFRRRPFVIKTWQDGKEKAYLILPPALPPQTLMEPFNVTMETLLKGTEEILCLADFFTQVNGRNLVFFSRKERELILDLIVEYSIPFDGYTFSSQEMAELMGVPILSGGSLEDLVKNFQLLLDKRFNDPSNKWFDDFQYLNPHLALRPLQMAFLSRDSERVSEKLQNAFPIPNDINSILGAGGILDSTSSKFHYRSSQKELAYQLEHNMTEGGSLLAEAPTGVGKSLAYLSAALVKIRLGEKVVISTYTKQLQNQLVNFDIPNFLGIFDQNVRVSQLQGIANYVCKLRLEEQKKQKMGYFVQRWLEEKNKELVSEIPEIVWEGLERDALSISSGECLNEACSFFEQCSYYQAIIRAKNADIVVTNHAMLGRLLRVLPKETHVIVDEAHHLYEAIVSNALVQVDLLRLVEESERLVKKGLEPELFRFLQLGTEGALKVARQLLVEKKTEDEIDAAHDGFSVWEILNRSIKMNLESLVLQQLYKERSAKEILSKVVELQKLDNGLFFISYDQDNHVILKGIESNFINQFQTTMQRKASSLSLLSATLFPKKWEDRFAKLLCIDEPRQKIYSSPFDIMRNTLFITPSDTNPLAYMNEAIEQRCEIIAEIAGELDGRTLVLFNSRDRMIRYELCLNSMLEQNGITLLVGDGPNSIEMLDLFRTARSGHVLLGLRSYWEGVDFPGDMLQCVIIESLPFRHHTDVQMILEASQLEQPDLFTGAILPDTMVTLLQGCGRLLRTESDRGAIVVLDKRLTNRGYGEELLSSLPYAAIRMEYKSIPGKISDFLDYRELHEIEQKDLLDTWTLDDVQVTQETFFESRKRIQDFARERFYVKEIKEWQWSVIESLLMGKQVLCVKETGAGKSLCYQIPALMRHALTLVVTPIVSLMRDQVHELQLLGFTSVGYIASQQDQAEREDVMTRLRHGEIRLLYISPERLLRDRFLQTLKNNILGSLIVDEAHCISQWGHNFRLDFLDIGDFHEKYDFHGIGAFTATAPEPVREDILEKLFNGKPTNVLNELDIRKNLHFRVMDFSKMPKEAYVYGEKIAYLKREIDRISGPILIYASTKHDVEAVCRSLQSLGVRAEMYHGGLEMDYKENVHDLFQDDHYQVVVATNAFGMGINKRNVRAVIHFDLTGSLEALYQEAGRAGRDAGDSECILMYHPSGEGVQESFLLKMEYSHEQVCEVIRKFLEKGHRAFRYRMGEGEERDEQEKMILYYLARYNGISMAIDMPLQFTVLDHEGFQNVLLALGVQCTIPKIWLVDELNNLIHEVSRIRQLILNWRSRGLIEVMEWGYWFTCSLDLKPSLDSLVGIFPFDELEKFRKKACYSFEKVKSYIRETEVCRVIQIHDYLGKPIKYSCGVCDICKHEVYPVVESIRERFTGDTQYVCEQLLGLMVDLKDGYALSYVINTLIGDYKRVYGKNPLVSNTRFGSLALYRYGEVKVIAEELIRQGYLQKNKTIGQTKYKNKSNPKERVCITDNGIDYFYKLTFKTMGN